MMVRINELAIELKSGIIFCFTALILSIVAGLAGKVPGGIIFYRSLIIIPFLSMLVISNSVGKSSGLTAQE